MIFGHDSVRTVLEASLPPVVMLRGPDSVGKWTLACHLVQHHGAVEADVRRVSQLTVDAARDLKQFAGTAPFGRRKYVVVDLDGASEPALNALLKLLEEPPPTVAFVLTSSLRTLDTITSRAQVHPLGLLPPEHMRQVLTARLGMAPEAVEDLLPYSRGQVKPLLSLENLDQSRAAVLSVLKALAEGDLELLERAAGAWDDSAHHLLSVWCGEALTGRWSVFSESETFGLLQREKMYPLRVLQALRVDARPKLAVRALLEPLASARSRS